jgi:hypothetical protein
MAAGCVDKTLSARHMQLQIQCCAMQLELSLPANKSAAALVRCRGYRRTACRRAGPAGPPCSGHLCSDVRRNSAAAPQNQAKRAASSLRPYTQPTQKNPFCGSRNVVRSSAASGGS